MEEVGHKTSTQTSFNSLSVGGDLDEERERGGRGGGRGGERKVEGLLEVPDEGTNGGPRLEDVFSKTLDSIVDRHFQQLDSSLKKLMAEQT